MPIVNYNKKIEKIYSRRGSRLRKLLKFFATYVPENQNSNDFSLYKKKMKAFMKVIVILVITVFVARNVIKSLNPIINNQCMNQAKNIAFTVTNNQAALIMKKYKYDDLVLIERDNDNRIQMIRLNIIPINEIIADVSINIQNELEKVDFTQIGITLGSFSGVKLLSGFGPKIYFKILCDGNVDTNLKSEFKTAGINQTLHQIYMEIDCQVSVLTPYDNVSQSVSNSILIAESIIIGDIPTSYYNME